MWRVGSHVIAEEWSDPRLAAARNAVKERIEKDNVNANLVLNIDQVWRQALRFSKTIYQKGKCRILSVHLYIYVYIYIYIHIYMCVFLNKITMYISKVSYRYNYVCRPPIPLMKAVIVLFIGFVDFVIYVCFARCVFETSDEHRAGRAFLL